MSNYTTNATTVLQINGHQAQQQLNQLRANALQLETAIAKAAAAGNRTDLRKLRSELNQTKRQINAIESSTAQVDNVLRRLNRATPKELQKALQTLTRQLQNIERGSSAWNSHVSKIQQVKAQIASLNAEMRTQEGLWARLNNKINEWMGTIMLAGAAVTGLIMAGRKAVNAYAEMEEELANTRKYTGMNEEQVKKLNEAFANIDTRTPREKLNELAQEAGRLGKTTLEDVQGYVEAADIINVALVDLGEGATQTIAKLTNIFRVDEELGTKQAMLSVGSAVNVLSQNCTASKQYLVEFTQRMAGVGAQAEMTIPQLLAFGATLDANGQKTEMSASALGKLTMMLFQKPGEVAQQVGLDVEKFTETLRTSTNDGLIMFLERIHELGSKEGLAVLAPLFKDLGMDGVRMSQVLATLAEHLDMVKWEQEEATKAFKEATSASNEYNIFNNTVQAGIDKAKNRIHEMAVELGEKLLPVMKHVMTSTSMIMRFLNLLVDFIIEHKEAIVTVTAAIVAYNAAAALATVRTKAMALATTAAKVAQEAWIAVQALASVAVSLFTGKITAATQSFKIFSATLKANPLGLIVSAVVALGTALYMYTKRASEAVYATKVLNGVRDEAKKKVAEETAKLRVLIAVAQDETKSLRDRQTACAELNKIIPKYNAQIDQTTGRYIASKNALEDYNNELQRKYELEGAKEALKKLGQEKAELIIKRTGLQKELENIKKGQGSQFNGQPVTSSGANMPAVALGAIGKSGQRSAVEGELASVNREIKAKEAAEKAITDEYGTELMNKDKSHNKTVADYNKEAGVGNVHSSDVGGHDDKKGDKNGSHSGAEDKFKEEKEWKEREEALNRIAYAKGEKDYEAFTKRMDDIAVEFYKKELAHKDLSADEKSSIEADYYEAIKKQTEDANKFSIEQEKAFYAEQVATEKQRFADGKVDHAVYEDVLQQMELAHLRRMTQITIAGYKERRDAEEKYLDARIKDQQKKQKEAEEAERKHQEELKKIKDEFFGNSAAENLALYNEAMSNLDAVYQAELNAAGDNAEEKLRIEEAYEKAKLALKVKYNQRGIEEDKNTLRRWNKDAIDWLNGDGGQAVVKSVEALTSGMSSIFSQLSSLVQAEMEIETAAIEKRYEREINRAEGNSYQVARLEKQKEKEIARVKNEANRKMFAMQVIQAVAQTAQNALSAYGSAAAIPVVGYILAPIAAAMAVAAGTIQIAAIKKQQEASNAQGYAEGGFTPKGNKYQEVGVVHAGEWVASQELLANPQARAIVNMLDYAQRTNTIGSIRQEDVSRSITAPMAIASLQTPTSGAVASPKAMPNSAQGGASMQELSAVIAELKQRLDEPFVTVNTITGDTGIKKAQDEYEKLMKNKSPKSRR